MIKSLRRKFIIVAMCSVLVVLVAVMGAVNAVNYANITSDADNLITILKEGYGNFGGAHDQPAPPDTKFETRYFFTVRIGTDGSAAVYPESPDGVAADEAAAFAQKLYRQNKTAGFYGSYRYGAAEKKDGTIYIFIDCSREIASFKNFLWTSIIVSALSLVLIFVLVFVFSGIIIRPVAESYEKQKRFITDASHEIKTPLTIIGADTDVLEMQDGENEWTADIKEQVARLTELTQKLVFLSRMDENGRKLNATDFCISDAVEETVAPFFAVALSRDMELKTGIQPNLTYCGDEYMIRQLTSLLVDNALKYADGKTVEVALAATGNKIQLTVKNRASYLQNGSLDLLFERFYRNDPSRNSETGGHGIGLSVAQSIAAAHKGKITAKKENETVIFTVIL